jgi:tRNA threonylcarbamoyladenosine biosynthesis protein TsaB
MRFIVLDTADARGSVALFDDGKLVRLESHSTDEDYSSWLLPAVRRVLAPSGLSNSEPASLSLSELASLSLSKLDGYAVCAGPGSFTGLRVGLTTVKAWSEIYGKPIAAVSRLEALTASRPAEPQISEAFVAACFDARRGQLFAAFYQKSPVGFTLIGEETVIPPAEFIRRVATAAADNPVRWRTPDPQLLQAIPEWQRLIENGHVLDPIAPPFAERLGWVAHRKFTTGQVTDAISLDANYVRRSDAELFWKDNRSAVKA